MRLPLSRLFSKLNRPYFSSFSSYEKYFPLPIILVALRWSRAFPAPSTRGRTSSALQHSPSNPAAADMNHSGPGSWRRYLGPTALRGWAGLSLGVPEPAGQERRWCRARLDPPPPDDAWPARDARLRGAVRRHRLRAPYTAELAPKPAPHAHPRSGRATGTWQQVGSQSRALPAAASRTHGGRGDSSPPRGRGDGREARCRPGQRRGRKRRTG